MKIITAIALLLFTWTATAQDRQAHEVEEVWVQLNRLAQKGKVPGMAEYVAGFNQRLEELSREFYADLCANSSTYRADQTKLLLRHQQYEVAQHEVYHAMADGLEAAFGTDFNREFRERVNKHRSRAIDTDLSNATMKERVFSVACTAGAQP